MYRVGDIVEVRIKHYGEKTGVVIESYPNKEAPQKGECLIRSKEHSRDIRASFVDLKKIY
tara:strand:+ start:8941 stop:9120 length:180 start_codon:yes stop_codon:yes gene_type:complete